MINGEIVVELRARRGILVERDHNGGKSKDMQDSLAVAVV